MTKKTLPELAFGLAKPSRDLAMAALLRVHEGQARDLDLATVYAFLRPPAPKAAKSLWGWAAQACLPAREAERRMNESGRVLQHVIVTPLHVFGCDGKRAHRYVNFNGHEPGLYDAHGDRVADLTDWAVGATTIMEKYPPAGEWRAVPADVARYPSGDRTVKETARVPHTPPMPSGQWDQAAAVPDADGPVEMVTAALKGAGADGVAFRTTVRGVPVQALIMGVKE